MQSKNAEWIPVTSFRLTGENIAVLDRLDQGDGRSAALRRLLDQIGGTVDLNRLVSLQRSSTVQRSEKCS